MNRRLALFDLDNTLLAGDSDHAWGEFLISRKLVDESGHRKTNDRFYAEYLAGKLDIHAWLAFTLEPVRKFSTARRNILLAEFVDERIRPMVLEARTGTRGRTPSGGRLLHDRDRHQRSDRPPHRGPVQSG